MLGYWSYATHKKNIFLYSIQITSIAIKCKHYNKK